jgi:OmpA family
MKILLLAILILIGGNVMSQSVIIHFSTGSNVIEETEISKLSILHEKEFNCDDVISINGYTDNVGSDESNKELSEKRAIAIKEFLSKILLEENNEDNMPSIEFNYFGRLNPIADNKTEAGRLENRRVEIKFSKKKCAEDGPAIDNLYELIKDKPQSFCINPLKDTAVIGKEGTIIYYKAGTFTNATNCTCITLLLNEYLDNASFIVNNLTTTSNGDAIESGGMTRLVGLCGKDTLQYQPGKFLIVMVPTALGLPDMKSFSANRKMQSDYLNWELDKPSSEVDVVDWNRFYNGCGGGDNNSSVLQAKNCPLFFCKIRRFLFGNKGEKGYDKVMEAMNKEQELIKNYDLNKDQMGDALLISKDVNSNALKYYVYKNANWDYHNIDRYKYGSGFINFYVNETPKPSKDVKLIYTLSKSVVPANGNRDYNFKNVFPKTDIWIVGLKYKDQQTAYLSVESTNTSNKETKLNFKEVNIAELKEVLKKLNTKN